MLIEFISSCLSMTYIVYFQFELSRVKMSEMNRPRWTKSNAGQLYIEYFDILNSSSGVEYLELLHEENLYEVCYQEFFMEKFLEEDMKKLLLHDSAVCTFHSH